MKRGILAISAALLLAAIMILPATGYTIKSENSPYPFSIGAEARPQFSIAAGEPAHELAAGAYTAERKPAYSIGTGKPYQYSLKVTPYRYSFNLANRVAAPPVPPVESIVPPVSTVTAEQAAAEQAAADQAAADQAAADQAAADQAAADQAAADQAAADQAAADQAAADQAAADQAAAAQAAAEAYTISGMVVDAETGTGIAALTVNLEQPAGTIINSAETAEDGSYSFADLMAGQYIVSVEITEGWETIEPAVVDLAENAVQDFTATKIPVAMPPVDVPADMPPAIA